MKILEAASGWGTGSSQMVIPSLAVMVAASRKDFEAAGNFKNRIQAEVYLNQIVHRRKQFPGGVVLCRIM